MSTVAKLAVDGGEKVRTAPFPNTNDVHGRRIGTEEEELVLEVLRSGSLNRTVVSNGKVEQFERAFETWVGATHAVASTSGTSALHLAVAAINPNPGDEIIVTPISDGGSVIPILAQNAIPVFADIDPVTWNMDPESVRANITDRTCAIMVVHLFGRPADMDAMLAISKEFNIPIIEDCSQAYGATWRGEKVGTLGDIGCFSMQQSKHMTAGDGGVTITNNDDLARRMRYFSDKGWPRDTNERTHLFLGLNYRMTELQGAVALAQLAKLDGVIGSRQQVVRHIEEEAGTLPGLKLQQLPEHATSVHWLYPINFDPENTSVDLQTFAKAMAAEGVGLGAGYVRPLYFTPMLAEANTYGDSHFPFDSAFTSRSYKDYKEGLCPVAESMQKSMFILAINENYTNEDANDIVEALAKVSKAYAK